jgi:hypothetical protein
MEKVLRQMGLDAESLRLLLPLTAVLAAALVGFLGFSVYEASALGHAPLGEAPPLFTPYFLARSAFALLFSGLIAWTVWRNRAARSPIGEESLGGTAVPVTILALGVASALLFLADPLLFNALSKEDRIVEWASAAALFGASGLFLWKGFAAAPDRLSRIAALVFAALFFIMAMEEISWMQRVVGFETPQELAQVNWQSEFNFHNVHTDLSENILYIGSAALLILLPFLVDCTNWRARLGPLGAFIPTRWVAAASASLSIFNYGMWNVIPQQMTMMLTVFVMAFYAVAAARRERTREALLFAGMADAVILGQLLFLMRGHLSIEIYDASEYKELFIALGLACFAWAAAFNRPASSPGLPRSG